ncbi:MAG: DUF4013 domain-containing protein [Nitrospirae bacterium]|nr:DUF4013 domain-containing protein [Nitrospirota bacterium]
MEDKKYMVVIEGVLDAWREEDVRRNLAYLFSIDESEVGRIFTNLPRVLKRGLTWDAAQKYKTAISKAGAACHIQFAGGAAEEKNTHKWEEKPKAQHEEPPPSEEDDEERQPPPRITHMELGGIHHIKYERESIAHVPFSSQIPGVFIYPLLGQGKWVLIAGALFFIIAGVIPFMGVLIKVILIGYMCAFMMKIITTSSCGEKALPDWPEFTNFIDDIIRPAFMVLAVFIVSNLPVIAYVVSYSAFGDGFLSFDADMGNPIIYPAIFIFIVAGMLYFPMAVLAVSMTNTFGAVSPHIVIPSIFRVPVEYLMLCGVLLAIYLVKVAVGWVVGIPYVGPIISMFVTFYFYAVEMRLVGLLYYSEKERLGWDFH